VSSNRRQPKKSQTNKRAQNQAATARRVPRTDPIPVQVLLVVPARPEMWPVVRMTATALASQVDFPFDGIEDLRLAVTELCSSCALDASGDATCECRFEISDSQFEMHCQVSPVVETQPPSEDHPLMSVQDLSRQILRATVDEFEIQPANDGMRYGHLRKERVSSVALQ